MQLIPLEDDQKTISQLFRKAPYFAIIHDNDTKIFKNIHKHSKSKEFLDYFFTLNVDSIIVKNLGYKTYKKLNTKVYFTNSNTIDEIDFNNLLEINDQNAKELCTLGHKK